MLFTNQKFRQVYFCQQKLAFNTHIGCVKTIDLASTCEVESNLTTKLEIKFQDDVDSLLQNAS
jgi:hypothetical protein